MLPGQTVIDALLPNRAVGERFIPLFGIGQEFVFVQRIGIVSTEGARGLFYWSFGIRALLWVKDPQAKEEYWQRLVAVTKELKSLEPALVAPDAPELVKSVSDEQIRGRARAADGRWYVFAYRPAQHFNERGNGDPIAVTFTMNDGQQVSKTFRPDTADWFALTPKR